MDAEELRTLTDLIEKHMPAYEGTLLRRALEADMDRLEKLEDYGSNLEAALYEAESTIEEIDRTIAYPLRKEFAILAPYDRADLKNPFPEHTLEDYKEVAPMLLETLFEAGNTANTYEKFKDWPEER